MTQGESRSQDCMGRCNTRKIAFFCRYCCCCWWETGIGSAMIDFYPVRWPNGLFIASYVLFIDDFVLCGSYLYMLISSARQLRRQTKTAPYRLTLFHSSSLHDLWRAERKLVNRFNSWKQKLAQIMVISAIKLVSWFFCWKNEGVVIIVINTRIPRY